MSSDSSRTGKDRCIRGKSGWLALGRRTMSDVKDREAHRRGQKGLGVSSTNIKVEGSGRSCV